MTKNLINVHLLTIYIDLDGGRVKELADELNKLLDEHGDTLVFKQESDYSSSFTSVTKERLETDEEYAIRMENEAEFKKFQKERELRLLAELKAKYGEV